MPRALFTSKNLIGDALYIQPALKMWSDQHPGWDIDLLTLDDHITCLYRGMGIPNLRVITEEEQRFDWSRPISDEEGPPLGGNYDFEHVFNVNEAFSLGETGMHISQAYIKLLGFPVPEFPVKVDYTPPEGPSEKGLVLLSMFSNSCASRSGKPPNKMLSWAIWLPIVTLARQLGKIAVLGGPDDKGKAVSQFREEEYYTGRSLEEVARLLRDAKLLITIDNGMGHLAASQGTPTILFYPACLGKHWIVPSGNKKLYVYQMDPMELNIHLGTLIVREGIKSLLGDQHEDHEAAAQEVSGETVQEVKGPEVSGETTGEEKRKSVGGGGEAGVLPG
jgi:ADP-heptose:LPS heptosyltransferase